jgi:hypothetical protein
MTAVIVPSFLAKVARAKKHLVDLQTEVDRFADTHPYALAESVEGKRNRKVRRLVFTASPANTDIPVIAADAIYNLRSSLDHLMASMVPKKDRRSVIFPVFFQGVWEPGIPGENQERIKQRGRWASDTKTLPDRAVAILKELQPPDDGGDTDQESSAIRLINRLSNRDRHEKLPVIASGLAQLRVEFKMPDGTVRKGWANPDPDRVIQNDAQVQDIPDDAMDVEVYGVPVVGIQIGAKRFVEVPDNLRVAAKDIEESVLAPLSPFVLP